MKLLFFTTCFMLVFFQAVFAQSHLQIGSASSQFIHPKEQELIVRFEKGANVQEQVQKINGMIPGLSGLTVKKVLSENVGIYLLAYEQCHDCAFLPDFLNNVPGILSAAWNRPVEFRDSIPNDPLFDGQWDMERIGLPAVWSVSTGGLTANGDEIVVAVLDKGFDLSHDELAGNIWVNPGEIPGDGIDNDGDSLIDDIHGWNFRLNSPFYTIEKHGTWVSGIVGARGNNNAGLAGTNWNVKIMFLGVEYADEVVAAFDYVLKMRQLYNSTNGEQGAFVVVTNGSFGIDKAHCSNYPLWDAMYDPLGEAGVLSVAATANEDWNVDEIGDVPTTCPSEYLIAVTSTDIDDHRVSNAAYGPENIDLAAPGKTTITTTTGNDFRLDFGGTSSACPHVAGSIALLYSMPCTDLAEQAMAQPAETARLMRDAILKNVDRLSELQDKTVTGGRLNVYESMKFIHAWCIGIPEEREAGNFKEIYIEQQGFIRVFPNPASGLLYVDYSNEDFTNFQMRIFNVLGQEMVYAPSDVTVAFENQQIEVDITDWPAGTYFITLSDIQQKVVRKFVKI